jgi:hypothetical protein
MEPSRPQSTGSPGTQQTHGTREEERGDYAFGIIFSSLYYVGRHHTDLVVKGLIMIARRPKAWRPSLRVNLGKVVLDKLLRHWALYKRPVHLPLLGGLRLLHRKNLSAGLLLLAMMVCDETQPCAFTRGAVGEDGGGPDNNDKNEGPKNKRKRRARVDLRAGSGKSDTTKPGEQPRKRKATAAIGEGSRPSAPSAQVHAALALTPPQNAALGTPRSIATRDTPRFLQIGGLKPTTHLAERTLTQRPSSPSERRPHHQSRGGRKVVAHAGTAVDLLRFGASGQ